MNAAINKVRVDEIHHLLLASGWTGSVKDGYAPPLASSADIAKQYGAGTLYVWDAINAQIRFDCFVLDRLKDQAA